MNHFDEFYADPTPAGAVALASEDHRRKSGNSVFTDELAKARRILEAVEVFRLVTHGKVNGPDLQHAANNLRQALRS